MTTIVVDLEGHMTYTAEKVVHQKGAQQKQIVHQKAKWVGGWRMRWLLEKNILFCCKMKILRAIQIIILDWSIFITLAGQFMRHSEGYLTLKEI